MEIQEALPVLVPLVAIQVGLQVFSLVDLSRAARRTRYLPKAAWAAIIVFGQLLGSVIYLVAGREEG